MKKRKWEQYHTVWLMLFMGWAVSYADRTITGPVISWMIANNVGFLKSAANPHALGGLLGSLFFAGYMLTQFPGGYFGDKYGHRTIIVISLFWAGIMTLITGVTGGLVAFIAFRVLTGLGEGVLYSNDRSLVAHVTPPPKMGFGMGIVITGLSLGFTSALLGTIHLINLAKPFMGEDAWRAPFLLLGAASLVVAFLVKAYIAPKLPGTTYGYKPALANLVKTSLIFLVAIMAVYAATDRLGLSKVGIAVILTCLTLVLIAFIFGKKSKELGPILREPNLVLLYISGIGICWHLWFYGYWSVEIVKEFGGGAFSSAALVASFNGLAGFIGFPLGGKIGDAMALRRNGRRNSLAFLMAVLTVLIFLFAAYLMSGRKDLVVMSILLFVSGVVFFALQAVNYTVTADLAPVELRGAAFGMWNLVAEVGAVLSPVIAGALRDATGNWSSAILLDGGLMAASCLFVLAIGRVIEVPTLLGTPYGIREK
ncbi:MFS transporter [Geobacter argillaceus]|uniref:Sugar phosphate permease n=1 Tax=Geobacter argillaceus TaxID=345631 RepID=A0A562VHC0_9BACT|nr:MFS transporter [Geobacter argillaceus]TWJ17353.1 sugar phosphate permease [Geobacter argillaceus]